MAAKPLHTFNSTVKGVVPERGNLRVTLHGMPIAPGSANQVHSILVPDTEQNRKAVFVGAGMAMSIWPHLSEMQASGIVG